MSSVLLQEIQIKVTVQKKWTTLREPVLLGHQSSKKTRQQLLVHQSTTSSTSSNTLTESASASPPFFFVNRHKTARLFCQGFHKRGPVDFLHAFFIRPLYKNALSVLCFLWCYFIRSFLLIDLLEARSHCRCKAIGKQRSNFHTVAVTKRPESRLFK